MAVSHGESSPLRAGGSLTFSHLIIGQLTLFGVWPVLVLNPKS